MKKWFKRIGIGLALLLVIVGAVAFWLLRTESGAGFALARAKSALQGKLLVAAARGTLTSPLELMDVRYNDPAAGIDVRVHRLHVEYALFGLLNRSLHVSNLDAEGVGVTLTTVPPPATSVPKPSLQSLLTPPLAITLDRAHVAKVTITQDAKPVLDADSADMAASWTSAGLAVRQFALRSPEGKVDISGALTSYADLAGSGKADVDWRIGERRIAGALTMTNNGREANFTLGLQQPLVANANGTLTPNAALAWTMSVDVPRFDPANLVQGDSLKSLALNLHGSGDRNGGSLTGSVDANAHRVLLDPLKFSLDGQTLVVENAHLRSPEAIGTLTAQAKVKLDAKPIGGEAKLAWEGVELPADLVGQVLATHGEFSATGNADRFSASGRLALGPPARLADIAFQLDGTPEKINLHPLELKQARGGLSADGEIALQPVLGWSLSAKADRFDTGAFSTQWPGALSFTLVTRGTIEKDGPHGTLKLEKLTGTLRQRPVSGNGDVTFAPPLHIDGALDLASGNSHVSLRGRGGAQTDANIELAIASLADWLPQSAGSVNGTIAIKGSWPKVDLNAQLQGRKLAFDGTHVEAFDASVHALDLSAPGGTLALHATRVAASGYAFDSVVVDANGNQGRHALKLDAKGQLLSAGLALEGGLTVPAKGPPTWRGSITTLTLNIKDQPPWQLAAAAPASYIDGAFSLGELCLHAEKPSLCVTAITHADGSLQSKYTLQHLPLALVVRLAVPEAPLRAAGEIDGSGDLARSATGALNGHAALSSASGSILYPDNAEQPLLAYEGFSVEAALAPQQSTVTLKSGLNDGGRLDGHITLGAPGDHGMPLGGEITAHLNNLRFVDLLTTTVSATKGSVNGHFVLGGTTASPAVSGDLAIKELATEVPSAGLKLTDGNIILHSRDAQSFDIDGTISSGGGKLTLGGRLALGSNAPLTLKINGENFLAADIPGAQVRISPALTLQRDAKAFSLSGEVTIPRANVDLNKLPGAGGAKVSSDVVVIDEKTAPATESSTSLPLDSVVTVKLGAGEKLAMDLRQGREVQLVGFGLDGNLGGQLTVQDHPGRATMGRGQIEVNGTYKAYGQDLTIEQGRLLFAGTPVENPGLDIRATRAFQDQNVTVGLQVRGTAAKPELTVFSTPAMEQSDALSYLVAGKPLSQLRGGEGDAVGSAARALGTAGSDLLAKSIGAKMGLDDVGVADNSSVGGAALTIGKYLSPRLYLSYGVGLFTPGEVVTLRYRLTRQFDAEMQNGTLSSRAGINYKIEK